MYYFVYILSSLKDKKRTYVGITKNIKRRIEEHNEGKSRYTRSYKPWKIVNLVCFKNRFKAYKFEKYLKTSSGRAFTKKRLI